ncbi:hypothetical protein ACFLRB_05530 [Acidobacteriota bacterium]
MPNQRKIRVSKVLIFAVILFMLNVTAFSRIYHNHGEEGYEDSGDRHFAGNTMNFYIIEGACQFLTGYSDVLLLLNYYEMSDLKGINYDETEQVLDRALNSLKNTGTTYDSLIALAENTPYNEVFLNKLDSFDYESFRKENSLNSDIFNEVETFLKKGDITGTFKRSRKIFDLIQGILTSIKESIELEKMPLSDNLWRLNHTYAVELLFGQYTAQVYFALKNNNE